ncbi:imidazolonepropionase [Halobacteriales archaeon QH_10_65_19]|nr:MAG: imidazolonepropionase [Halobacteriales archaeon QH_10_65_19]
MTTLDTVVHSASEVFPAGDGEDESAAVAVVDGDIAAVGPTGEVCREYPPENADRAIDASGKTVLPGFVDPHTHAVFAGDRSDEFVAKIEGKSYTEIMAAGGGIPVTVEAVQDASEDELVDGLCEQLDVMLAHGTTTAEVKSGYGLDTETELRMLAAIERADERHPVDLVPTFMGAHEVPQGEETEAYVESVVEEQLPAVADQEIAQFCDVFCEEGVFDVEQSQRVLEAGREHGLAPKIHAEEFSRIGGAALAADLGATSADHLLQATDEDARALAEAGVVPTLLPATAFVLGEPYADPDPFLDAGAPLALGSDLNPSCFVHSVPFVVSLACLRMGLLPGQAIRGATRNAARALDCDGTGTLAEGTAADLAVVDLPSHVHLAANAGTNRVETVVADGAVVVDDGRVRR